MAAKNDFKSRWAASLKEKKETKSNFPTFQDGQYIMRLISAERGESKKGRHQVVLEFLIQEGPADKGDTYRSYHGLDDKSLLYTQNDLERLGVNIEAIGSWEELDMSLVELIADKPSYKLKLVTKGDFQNIRNLARAGADVALEPTVVDEPVDDVFEE